MKNVNFILPALFVIIAVMAISCGGAVKKDTEGSAIIYTYTL